MKLRRLLISPELLEDFLLAKISTRGVTSDAPGDLKIIHARSTDDGMIELLVSSASFNDPTDVSDPPPLLNVLFTTCPRWLSR